MFTELLSIATKYTKQITVTAAVTTVVVATIVLGSQNAGMAQTFNVRSFGATGNGTTIDTPAINRAITAANSAGGGIVEFPAGRYLSVSIHLKSNVTLQLDSGATILAASSGFDAAEPNSFSRWQDFGHSHFHNALIWGENLRNVGFTGTGTIDGNDHLTTSNSVSGGHADKAISLKLIDGITITDITVRRGGHFAILANGCTNMNVARVKILNRTDRDAFNLINSSHVNISDSVIEGSDDSMVLKSDFALGRKITSEDIHVRDSTILSTENNALQFGSETCGDFFNVSFSNITITAARKAGIGITSNDGAIIDGVTYDDIRMTNTTTPIFMKIDDQHRCPNSPPPGRIRNIRLNNITAIRSIQDGREFTSAISGKPGIPIENVTLTNVKITVPGGHPASDVNIDPPENNDWTPKSLGTRPSYGWFLRHVRGITFNNCEVQFDSSDGRPAFIAVDGQSVTLDGFVEERGSSSAYDVGFDSVNGYCVMNSSTTTGSTLRINAVDSTATCGVNSTTLIPIADTYVRDGSSADTNFGAALDLQVKANPTVGLNRRIFLKFDIGGLTTVSSARLRLFGNFTASGGGASPVTVHIQNTDSWTETGLTWNNQPAAGSAVRTVSVGTTAQYWEWDLTSLVQDQISNGQRIMSLELENDVTTTNPASFNSREATANKPQLVIAP